MLVGVPGVVGVVDAGASDAITYNPWGFRDGQALTEAEASAVLLHQVNLQRSLIGLPSLTMSNDRSGAICSANKLADTLVFRHYNECIPSNHHENIYGSFSSGSATIEAAGPWTTSTSGHNQSMYSPTATHAQMAVRCTTAGTWASSGYVAFQPVNVNGYTSSRSTRANVAVLQNTNAHYAATGVTCDGATLRFRLHPDLRAGASYLVYGERAVDPNNPELWHRFQVARLYAAYFDRAPDNNGWAYWNQRSVDGMSTWRISDLFTESPEFRATYGASLSNGQFIDLVYQNVLDRQADAGGKNYWLQRMASRPHQGPGHGPLLGVDREHQAGRPGDHGWLLERQRVGRVSLCRAEHSPTRRFLIGHSIGSTSVRPRSGRR